MRYSIFFGILIFCLCSCKSDSTKKDASNDKPKEIQNKIPEGELAQRLYANYNFSPTNQKEVDENALIKYAVDKNLDVKRTNTGLYYLIEKEGVGPNYIMNQPCKAHYSGYFLDGKVFDSSMDRGEPLAFSLGQMNKGWNEGLQLMNTGTKAKLLIPSHLGYGERGFPGYVPPNTPLVFDLELLPLN